MMNYWYGRFPPILSMTAWWWWYKQKCRLVPFDPHDKYLSIFLLSLEPTYYYCYVCSQLCCKIGQSLTVCYNQLTNCHKFWGKKYKKLEFNFLIFWESVHWVSYSQRSVSCWLNSVCQYKSSSLFVPSGRNMDKKLILG